MIMISTLAGVPTLQKDVLRLVPYVGIFLQISTVWEYFLQNSANKVGTMLSIATSSKFFTALYLKTKIAQKLCYFCKSRSFRSTVTQSEHDI